MSNIELSLIPVNAKCSCKGDNLDKLIQPMILTMLFKNEMHGYLIIQELINKEGGIDKTGVYRTLKNMEERGLVSAGIGINDEGMQKKPYCITPMGKECLMAWIGTLKAYTVRIGRIINDAEEVINANE